MMDAEKDGEQDLPVTARNLKSLLEKSGMTQAEVARQAHIARDALGRYLHGVNKPPARRVMSLAEVFGVSHRDIDPSLPEELNIPRHVSEHDELFSVHPSNRPGHMRVKMDAELSSEAVAAIVEIVGRYVRK